MRSDRRLTSLKKILICCQYALMSLGFSALGYCAWVFAETTVYQDWAFQRMQRERTRSLEETLTRLARRPVPRPDTRFAASLREVSPLGRIEIPRLGVSAMIAEGVTARVLKIAIGHIPDTAWPGQDGNVALAGHRDTFFRPLRNVRSGDLIKLTTFRGQYWYVVRFTDIVDPDETWPLDPSLDPSNDQTLTLVTCYPFYYVGAAPRRFIVRARRLESSTDVQSSERHGPVTRETIPDLSSQGDVTLYAASKPE